MIKVGSKIRLLPNMNYADHPERNEDVGTGENKLGKYLQMQVMDSTIIKGKKTTGFFYVRIFTDISLVPNDMVTVKEIVYAQKKNRTAVIGIKIEEQTPMSLDTFESEDSEDEYDY